MTVVVEDMMHWQDPQVRGELFGTPPEKKKQLLNVFKMLQGTDFLEIHVDSSRNTIQLSYEHTLFNKIWRSTAQYTHFPTFVTYD